MSPNKFEFLKSLNLVPRSPISGYEIKNRYQFLEIFSTMFLEKSMWMFIKYWTYLRRDCRVILKQSKMLNFFLQFELQLLINFIVYFTIFSWLKVIFLIFFHVQHFNDFYSILFELHLPIVCYFLRNS